jgi:hypothetical protein
MINKEFLDYILGKDELPPGYDLISVMGSTVYVYNHKYRSMLVSEDCCNTWHRPKEGYQRDPIYAAGFNNVRNQYLTYGVFDINFVLRKMNKINGLKYKKLKL